MSRSARHHGRPVRPARATAPGSVVARRVGRFALALLLVGLTLALTGSPAQATAGLEVGIRTTTDNPAASGTRHRYELKAVCTRSDGGCDGVELRLPLGDAADWNVQPGEVATPQGVTATTARQGDDLVVSVVGALQTGQSVTAPVDVTTPTDTLADGTAWDLEPRATSTTAFTGTTPPQHFAREVTTTATAEAHLEVVAEVVDSTLRAPGEEVVFDLAVSCLQPEVGNLFPGRIEVEAQLDDDLELVDIEPGGRVRGDTVTWEVSGDDRPESCQERGAQGASTATLTAVIADELDDNDELPLTLRATPTTGGHHPRDIGETVETTALVTVLSDPGSSPGSLFAAPFGQVRTSDPGGSSEEDASHATYPGDWLGSPADLPADLLPRFQPNAATGLTQAGFKIAYNNVAGSSGYQVALEQVMPCLGSGSRHEPSDGGCAPAFHPTAVALWVDNDREGRAGPAVPASYRPSAVLTSGRRIDLVRTGGTTGLADGGQWATFEVPASAVGDVRAIGMPRAESIASDRMYWAVLGHADAATEAGDVLVSRTYARSHRGSWEGALDPRDATLTVAGRPQVGVTATYADDRVDAGEPTVLRLDARALLPSTATRDLVLSTRLPDGIAWSGEVPATVPVEVAVVHAVDGVQQRDTVQVPAALAVAGNVDGSGESVVRATVPASALAAWTTDGGGARVDARVELPLLATRAGVHEHEVRAVVPGVDVAEVCAQPGSPAAGVVPVSATGLPGRAAGCSATTSVRALSGDGTSSFSVDARVRGDRDSGPKASPALGLVDAGDGTAEYTVRWRNTGETPLRDVVLYDVLPAVGDTHVAGAASGSPRRSGFGVTLLGVEAGDGVQVTTAATPAACRPELGTGTSQCGAWRDDLPPADARAVRVTSRETYDLGEGFDVTLRVAVPDGVAAGSVAWHTAAATARSAWSGTTLPGVESAKLGITPYAASLPPVVSLRADRAYAAAGEGVTYTVELANPGPTPITTAAPVAQLPVGLQFLSATADAVVRFLLDLADRVVGGAIGSLLGSDPSTEALPTEALPTDPAAPAATTEVRWAPLELGPYERRTVQVVATPDQYAAGSLLSRFVVEGAIVPQPCVDGVGLCAEVNIPSGTVRVTHASEGEGAALFAGAVPASVQVDCVRDGRQVHGFPRVLPLGDGETSAALNAPFGATCSAAVVQDQGGASVATEESSALVTPEASAADLRVVTRFDLARLVVGRGAEGVGRGFAPRRAPVSVDCTWRGERMTGFPVTLQLDTDGSAEVGSPLPVGAVCTATDASTTGGDAPGRASVQLAPGADGAGAGVTTLQVATRWSAGRLVVAGADDLRGAARVAVTCVREDEQVWSGTVQVAPGGTAVAASGGSAVLMPPGTACTAAPGAGYRVSADEAAEAVTVAADAPGSIQDLVITVSGGSPLSGLLGGGGRDGSGRADGVAPGGRPVLGGLVAGLLPGVPGGALAQEDPTARATPGAPDPEGAAGLGAPAAAPTAEEGRSGVPVLPLALGGLALLLAGAVWTRLRRG